MGNILKNLKKLKDNSIIPNIKGVSDLNSLFLNKLKIDKNKYLPNLYKCVREI